MNDSYAEVAKFSNRQAALLCPYLLLSLSLFLSLSHFQPHLQVLPVMLCLPDLYRDWANCQISFTKIGTSIALTLSGAGGLLDCPIGLSSHVACVALVLHAAYCRYSPQQLPQHQYTRTHTGTLKVASFGYDYDDHFAVLVELPLPDTVLETETKLKTALAMATAMATQLETLPTSAVVVGLP